MHRVRVGLIGLCSVFLLVMLATAIFRVASDVPKARTPDGTVNSADSAPSEPLAQLGVAPGNGLPDDNMVAAAVPPPPNSRR